MDEYTIDGKVKQICNSQGGAYGSGVVEQLQAEVTSLKSDLHRVTKSLTRLGYYLQDQGIASEVDYVLDPDYPCISSAPEGNGDLIYCVWCKEEISGTGGSYTILGRRKIYIPDSSKEKRGSYDKDRLAWENTCQKLVELRSAQGLPCNKIMVTYAICNDCDAPEMEKILRGHVFAKEVKPLPQKDEDVPF